MPLPINVEDLLMKRRIESNLVEFKESWNPDSIYRTVCAFANDLDNIGGGYILVGVEEEKGIAKRPVCGINPAKLDSIQKEMVGFNNLIDPYYCPKTSIETIDGVPVLAIWVPTGDNRPYKVPSHITARQKDYKIYVRTGTSSIVAKGAIEREILELSKRVPFDERGNVQIKEKDISIALLRDYLAKVDSKLLGDVMQKPLMDTLSQMNLIEGPAENQQIKNVAAMMFCDTPEKFFPYTQVDIVRFKVSRIETPDVITSNLTIRGPVPKIIYETMASLRLLIEERTIKLSPDERTHQEQRVLKITNYPIKALEEVVVNALYHRDYSVWEPIEITVEQNAITVVSYSGPDRSISAESLKKGQSFVSRRYRNRRLGEFLRELELTEGRATGIGTIQRALRENGSPEAIFETNEERTYFLVKIPIHPNFLAATEIVLDVKKLLQQKLEKIKGQFEDDPYFDKLRLASIKERSDLIEDIRDVIRICQTSKSATEICAVMTQYTVTPLKRQLIGPLVTLGILEMTIPNRPKSKLQRYVSTIQVPVEND